MIAPASLKQDWNDELSRDKEATPGHDCPGLIEADVVLPADVSVAPYHSGA